MLNLQAFVRRTKSLASLVALLSGRRSDRYPGGATAAMLAAAMETMSPGYWEYSAPLFILPTDDRKSVSDR